MKSPKFDVQLMFEEIGFILDDHQYRDIISMVDMYHFFLRQQQVSNDQFLCSNVNLTICSTENSDLLRKRY